MQIAEVKTQFSVYGAYAIMSCCLLAVVCFESLFRKASLVISLIIIGVLLGGILVSVALSGSRASVDQSHLLVYFISVIYTMLPVNKRTAVGLGVTSGLAHLILAGIMANKFTKGLAKQVAN